MRGSGRGITGSSCGTALRQIRGRAMTRRGSRLMIRAICSIALAAAAMPAWAETMMLASTYDEVGTNPNGSSYTGTVNVEVISDTTFKIRWKIGSTVYSGFGMRMNDTLAATY